MSRKARKRSSSSRLVMLRPMSRRSRSRLMAGVPGRPGYRATRSAREVGLPRRRISASVAARSRCCGERIAARSRSVRAGVVTGMRRSTVTSSAGSPARWISSRSRRFSARGTVISVRARSPPRMPQSAAAERWLSTARGLTSVAAIHAASRRSASWPTAYTPRCTGSSRRSAMRWSTERRCIPSARSCRRETTPCCRVASAATASSRRIRPLHPMLWSRSNASDTSPIVPLIPCRRNHPTAPKLFALRTGVRAPP